MARKRKSEHGTVSSGRLQLDRDVWEILRTYTRMKLIQAREELGAARRSHLRMRNEISLGRLHYAEHVVGWLEGLYSTGQASVDPALWAECWRDTTTVERHTTRPAELTTKTIPGME